MNNFRRKHSEDMVVRSDRLQLPRVGVHQAGAVLIELLIVIVLVILVAFVLWGLFTTITTTTRYTVTGSWAPGSCPQPPNSPAVRSTPYSVSYLLSNITETTTTTITPPIGAPRTKTSTATIPIQGSGASVTFSLVGKGGAIFVTGGRQYTMLAGPSGKTDIKLVAVNKASDEIAASVNFSGGVYPDAQTCLIETQP